MRLLAWMLPVLLFTGCTYRTIEKAETFEEGAILLKRVGGASVPFDYYLNTATVGDWSKVVPGVRTSDGAWEIVAVRRFDKQGFRRLVVYRVEFGQLRSYEIRQVDEAGYYGAVINGTLLPK